METLLAGKEVKSWKDPVLRALCYGEQLKSLYNTVSPALLVRKINPLKVFSSTVEQTILRTLSRKMGLWWLEPTNGVHSHIPDYYTSFKMILG